MFYKYYQEQIGNNLRIMNINIKENAQSFLTEISGNIAQLADNLSDDFAQCAQIIHESKGRLIITGVGKSGLIGRKIVATFASLGKPAYFIHPTEASHGDMGALTKSDVLLALSKSGETMELANILNYAKSQSIPIMAICANAQSKLGKIADKILLISNIPEAGKLQTAPTTSTTQTLVLGDALALAVMNLSGFNQENFHQLHPGGSLGLQLTLIKKIMVMGDMIPLVSVKSNLTDALHAMDGKKFGAMGVVNADNMLLGMITDGDLRRHLGADFFNLSVDKVMTANPLVCTENAFASEVLQKMNQKNINVLFVVDGEDNGMNIGKLNEFSPAGRKIKGIVHIHEIFRAGIIA